jgi:acyl carrier protein
MAAISQSKAQRRAANGIGAIHPDQGLEALAQLLNSPSPQVAVLNIDWPSLAESLSLGGVPPLLGGLVDASTQAVETTGMKRSEVVIKLEAAPLEERKKILVEFLRERVVKVLGLSPAFVLDTRRPLNEMGLDSLMAVELKNVLDQALGHKLSATLVFEYPTIDAIASYLLSEVLTFADGAVPEPEAQPISDPINQTEHLLDKLETLSDDEAEALLLDKLAAFNKKKS